ncbi:tail protein [Enterococcus phage VRE9_4]
MATISSGQITIIDLYDAPALNAWISASQTTTQTYNNTTNTYSPNFGSSAQVLTLNLTKAGGTGSLIGSAVSDVKWKKTVGATTTEITSTTNTDSEYKGGASNSVLTTKVNVPTTNNAVRWTVEGVYTDPDTSLPITFQATIDINLIQLAKAAVVAVLSAPNGSYFRNNTPSSLKLTADVYKDGDLSNGSRKYKWFAADSSVSTSQDSDAGIGWRKITATTGTSGAVASSGFDVAVTVQGVLTVYPDAVTNGQTFLCVVTDNAGGTSGTKMKQYITLMDMDDPIMVVIESSGGNILKNGVGSTTLKARLYQNGEEIDSGGTGYTYKWSKWQNNAMVPNFGGTSNAYKTGKSLSVGSADVDNTTTFKVEVENK